MTPEPPLITISDPNNPGRPVDVVGGGSDRDPWRPTRRTWTVLGVAALVAAVVVPSVLLAQQRASDRAKDREALRQVQLATMLSQAPPTSVSSEVVGVRNDGALAVRILAFQVVAPGYRQVSTDVSLAPYDVAPLEVPDTATCSPGLLTGLPAQLWLTVRTTRGQVVRRTVPLTAEASMALVSASQRRCRYLPTNEALVFSLHETHTVGRTLVASVNLVNQGHAPLTVTFLDAGAGFTVTASRTLPFSLPPEPTDGARGVDVTLRLRVGDCQAARTAIDDANQGRAFGGTPGGIHVLLTGATGEDSSEIAVLDVPDVFVQRACG